MPLSAHHHRTLCTSDADPKDWNGSNVEELESHVWPKRECGRNEGYFFYKRLNCYLPEMPHDSVVTYKSNCSKAGFQFLMLEMILSPEAIYRDYHRSFALTLSHYSISRNFMSSGSKSQTGERWEPAPVT